MLNNTKIFWGADHKVGTTMIAQLYAEALAADNKSVLLLTVGSGLGDDFFSEPTGDINELRSRLSCGLLTKEIIKESAQKNDKIYKLNGLLSTKDAFAFTEDMVIKLIKISRDVFDHVVVDCGTGLSNPLVVGALSSKYSKHFVFTQSESGLRRWEQVSEQMSKLGVVPQSVIVNKFIKGDSYSTNYISQRTGIPQNLFKTVCESDFGIQAESERKTLLYFGEKQLEKDVDGLLS